MKKNIAVCVAVYNEEKTIAAMINSVFSQNMLGTYNINMIIIASGCTDLTIPIIDSYIKQGYAISLTKEESRSGKSNALSRLFQLIKTKDCEFCVFTDGDVLLDKNSIHQLIRNFHNVNMVDAICGQPIPVKSHGFWYQIAQENCTIWHFTRRELSKKLMAWPLSGYLYAIRTKSLTDKIPQHIVADDSFIGLSIILSGGKISYVETARVKIGFPKNLSDYYRQKSRNKYGWRQLSQISLSNYNELKKIQRNITFQRFASGNYWSLFCWVLDYLVNKIDQVISRFKSEQREVWAPIPSSKIEEHE